MGMEIIRDKMGKENFLLNRLYEDIEIWSNFFDVFIITDARLVREFESIKDKYTDVATIKLVRDNYDDELTEEEAKHVTEADLNNYTDFDYVIENKTFADLKRNALEVVRNEERQGGI